MLSESSDEESMESRGSVVGAVATGDTFRFRLVPFGEGALEVEVEVHGRLLIESDDCLRFEVADLRLTTSDGYSRVGQFSSHKAVTLCICLRDGSIFSIIFDKELTQ